MESGYLGFFEDLYCITPMHQGFLMFFCGSGGIFPFLPSDAQCCCNWWLSWGLFCFPSVCCPLNQLEWLQPERS